MIRERAMAQRMHFLLAQDMRFRARLAAIRGDVAGTIRERGPLACSGRWTCQSGRRSSSSSMPSSWSRMVGRRKPRPRFQSLAAYRRATCHCLDGTRGRGRYWSAGGAGLAEPRIGREGQEFGEFVGEDEVVQQRGGIGPAVAGHGRCRRPSSSSRMVP